MLSVAPADRVVHGASGDRHPRPVERGDGGYTSREALTLRHSERADRGGPTARVSRSAGESSASGSLPACSVI